MKMRSRRVLFVDRPFEGKGASLYAGVGASPGVDPGADSIVFSHLRVHPRRWLRGTGNNYGDGVTKTARIAVVNDPTAEFSFATPAEWLGMVVWIQVRTFAADVENPTTYRPVRIEVDSAGDPMEAILGVGEIIATEKLDGGHYRIYWTYEASDAGLPPTQFRLAKSAGPGTVADTVEVVASTGLERLYSAVIPALGSTGLTNGGYYTFELSAENGSTSVILDSVPVTADAVGPGAPSGLVIEEL